jgi:hypothetical protein
MGMDVTGNNPDNEIGEYFRASVWGWHPLWNYCEYVAPSLTSKVKYGHTNDGDGLSYLDSKHLAHILRGQLKNGGTAEYIVERDKQMDALPDEKCTACEGTGVLMIRDETMQCSGCKGAGTRRPITTWYQLDKETVYEFAEFLEHCGGFKIY